MKRILCHGDSLTEASTLEPYYRWPTLVGNRFGLEMVNTGVGGDTTGGLLARFPVEVVPEKPDGVIIFCGTNDLWWDLNIGNILANIFSMAFQAACHEIAPVIGVPIPIIPKKIEALGCPAPLKGFDRCVEKLERLSRVLPARAAESGIACAEFYPLFLDEKNDVKESLFMDDGIHPNRDGHRIIAEAVIACLKKEFLLN